MNTEMLSQLNDSQRVAVEYCDGASLVIAGAGSGKTRVLTYKIAWLLEQGMKPWQILALTFTNKAAREMKDRIGRLVGEEQARYLQMGTFHSVFARILRAEADKLGYNANLLYTIRQMPGRWSKASSRRWDLTIRFTNHHR
jgi:DNA helicase-2/ATP-dependent DNA helicase PcrA